MRPGADIVRLGHTILHEPHGRGLELAIGALHLGGKLLQFRLGLGRRADRIDFGKEGLYGAPAILGQLAADQVHRLNAVGAFIDLGNAGIADELAHAPFLDVAMPAKDLLHLNASVEALVRAIALQHRGEQADHVIRRLALFLARRLVAQVDQQAAPQVERAHPFGERLGVHQHAAHVRVDEQWVGLFLRLGRTGQGAALAAILRILHGVLIGGFGLGQALDANAQARGIHHDEHGGQALVFLTDHPSGCAVIVHHAGRVAVNAHLVFDAAARHRIALPQRAIVVDENLRHDEQRNALAALRRTRRLGQDQVNDVLGHVMLTGRDEDLGPGDRIAAIGIGHGAGADQAQVRAAVRLGQVHGAGPFARDHPGQVLGLLLGAALGEDGADRPGGQARIHAPGLVRGGDEFLDHEAQHVRHALPTEFLRCGQSAPTSLTVELESFLESRRRGDGTIGMARTAFLIAREVDRREHFGGELAALLNHRVHHVGTGVFEPRQIAVLFNLQHFVENETGVARRRLVDRHGPVLG